MPVKIEKQPVRAVLTACVLGSSFMVAGCMSSPTYGTDKTANAQLADDVSNIFKPLPGRKAPIDYQPRPDLVRPAGKGDMNLPAPQEALASNDNQAWPESPEQRRKRIREETDANRNNQGFKPEVVGDDAPEQEAAAVNKPFDPIRNSPRYREGTEFEGRNSSQSQEIKRRIAQNQQGSATTRRYLSEPPVEYRAPATDAPTGDVGEDEWKKERRLKAEARKKSGKTSWRDFVPGL